MGVFPVSKWNRMTATTRTQGSRDRTLFSVREFRILELGEDSARRGYADANADNLPASTSRAQPNGSF